jgi:TolB-like protein
MTFICFGLTSAILEEEALRMKNTIKALSASIFLILTMHGLLYAGERNKPVIKTVDNYVAVFDFEVTTGDKGISRPLTDSTIHEFSQSNKYEVIDRGNMNKILSEQKFQMTGCVAQECRVEAGQLLGVGKIVTGSVGLLGKTYFMTLQLINVQTGKVELSATDECKCEIDELIGSTRRLVKKLIGDKVEYSAATVTGSKTEKVTKAEAISKSKETRRDGRFVDNDDGTVTDTKTGLMWAAKDNGSRINWPDAKSYCENYRGGGYTDWRMPTQDELAGLYDSSKTYQSNCGPDVYLTELIRLTCNWAWASETSGSDFASFDFDYGFWDWVPQFNDYYVSARALPVRSVK